MATAQTQIGEFRIEVTKLPAMKGVRLSARLARVIGPAIAAAFSGGVLAKVKNVADLDVSKLNIDAIARALFERLHPDELEAVLRELLAATLCNGQPIMETFDVLFADKLELVVPLVRFVLGYQFGSFGRALLAAGSAWQSEADPTESASSSTRS